MTGNTSDSNYNVLRWPRKSNNYNGCNVIGSRDVSVVVGTAAASAMESLSTVVEAKGVPKRFKRFRSRPFNTLDSHQRSDYKELLFLQDLHFGHLPDNW